MNREIKFRGKRIKNAEWITGSLFTRNTEAWIFTGDDIDCFDGECSMWVDIDSEVILKTVGQYTGLKDKNGNDIYEGDIVKGVSHKFDSWSSKLIPFDVIGVVGYHKEYQTLEVSTGQQSSHIEGAVKGEVIGNIHDNPELL